jgi:mRNA-degrading endonuclease RelE of RelBE toxin-antitoxin system
VYEVLIERTAERDLKSLPTAIFNRIVPRIRALPLFRRRYQPCSKFLPTNRDVKKVGRQ